MSATQAAIVIRDIQTLEELSAVEELQKEVWRVEDREVVPALTMIPMKHVGGLLLGAFDAGALIGFSFAFPGFEDGRPILHSDMLAVKPAYRSMGLGLQLKLTQRERAMENGIDTITWTFDPLQSLNANLNFAKLGAISNRYFVNYYGETTSFLHSTGTDRLWVTWKLKSKWVVDRIDNSNSNTFPETLPSIVKIGLEEEPIVSFDQDSSQVFLDVPGDYNRLVKEKHELAKAWRAATREAFANALAAGYIVQDFRFIKNEERSLGRYLLIAKSTTGQ